MGYSAVPSGFLEAASGTEELLGREGRLELPAALSSWLTDHRPFMPAFSWCPDLLVSVPSTSSQPGSPSVGIGSGPPPLFDSPSLPQLVFPPRKRYFEETLSRLLFPICAVSFPTAATDGGVAILSSEPSTLTRPVCACMLTLQPDRCLSELNIRVTAACPAVC